MEPGRVAGRPEHREDGPKEPGKERPAGEPSSGEREAFEKAMRGEGRVPSQREGPATHREGRPKEPGEERPSAKPPSRERGAFEKALGEGERGKKAADTAGETPAAPSLAGMQADLSGMVAQMSRHLDKAPAVTAPPPPAAAASPDVAEIADRILVAAPEPGQQRQEVRITFKESVLPETEVRIVRDGDTLSVQFRTENPDANRFLAVHQSELQERLTQRLGIDISLSLDYHEQDGRSRGRRNLYEEMEEQR